MDFEFETVVYQKQWVAQWGLTDQYGRQIKVLGEEVFPERKIAEAYLDERGYLYNERLLRREVPWSYGYAETKYIEQKNQSKWK